MNIQTLKLVDGTEVFDAEIDFDRPADPNQRILSAVLHGNRNNHPVRRVQVNTRPQSVQPVLTIKPIKQHRIAG